MWIRGLCTHSTTPIRQPWQRVAVRNRKQCIILYKWRDRNTSVFIKSEVLSAIVEIGSWNYGNMRGRGVRQDWRRNNSIAFLTSEYKLARWWGKGKGDREKGKLIGMGNLWALRIYEVWVWEKWDLGLKTMAWSAQGRWDLDSVVKGLVFNL